MNEPCAVTTVLRSGVVVDKSKFSVLTADEASKTMAWAYSHNKRVVFVANTSTYFRASTLINFLKDGNADWELVADKLGVTVPSASLVIIQQAQDIIDTIVQAAGKIVPPYPFADIPAGWSVETHIKVINSSISRKNGEGYSGRTEMPKAKVQVQAKLQPLTEAVVEVAAEAPVENVALISQAPQPEKANVFSKVHTYDDQGKVIDTRVIDMSDNGARKWLLNHCWWANTNSQMVGILSATKDEHDRYQLERLARRFNKVS